MNTWLSFRSAQPSKVAQFSVGGNSYVDRDPANAADLIFVPYLPMVGPIEFLKFSVTTDAVISVRKVESTLGRIDKSKGLFAVSFGDLLPPEAMKKAEQFKLLLESSRRHRVGAIPGMTYASVAAQVPYRVSRRPGTRTARLWQRSFPPLARAGRWGYRAFGDCADCSCDCGTGCGSDCSCDCGCDCYCDCGGDCTACDCPCGSPECSECSCDCECNQCDCDCQ